MPPCSGRCRRGRAARPRAAVPIAKSDASRCRATSEDAPARRRAARRCRTPSSRYADPGGAEVEQLDRGHDDQHAKRAGDQRLRAVEAHDQAQAAARRRSCVEADERLRNACRSAAASRSRTGGRPARMRATWNAESRKVAGGDREQRLEFVTPRRSRRARGRRRDRQRRCVLMVTLAAVSSSGVRAMRREEGRLSRPEGGREGVDQRRKAVDGRRPGRRSETTSNRGRQHQRAADVGEQHHALPPEPIGEDGRERRRRSRPRGRGSARRSRPRSRPRCVVREDGDADDVHPLSGLGTCPRELDTAQVRVGEDRPERAERLAIAAPAPGENCIFPGKQGRFRGTAPV